MIFVLEGVDYYVDSLSTNTNTKLLHDGGKGLILTLVVAILSYAYLKKAHEIK